MPKPSWSCLGVLFVALLFQASVEVHGWCQQVGQCKDSKTQDSLMECIKSCNLELPPESLGFPGNGQNELKQTINYSRKKYKQRNNHSGSISSDGRNVEQKRQELMQGDFMNLLPPGIWGEDKKIQGEGLPLIRKVRQLDTKRSYSMEHFRWGKPVGKKRRPVKVYPNGVEEESAESYPTDFRRDLPMKTDYPEVPELTDDEMEDAMVPYEDKMKKNGGGYKMEHFRWGTPPKNKRYGGFMISEKDHTPLMTLFKNAIIKNAHEKGQ
ncbi:pro-opiomelanocortin [Macrotis lagotis]|uniref:pro-opiomelanocortin n=1 Tax=Macrotis lagotis TaxID=92651 RepID=UPI003D693A81